MSPKLYNKLKIIEADLGGYTVELTCVDTCCLF